MMLRSLAGLLSPAGPRARLSILIYHRVLPQPDPLLPDEPDVRRFSQELEWLGRWFQVLPLEQAAAQLAAGTLPARAAAITFDDGYANNFTEALPVLQHHNMSATFFIATDFLDGGLMWNDAIIESIRRCRHSVLDLEALGLGRHTLGSDADRRTAISTLLVGIKYREPAARLALVQAVSELAGAALPSDLMMQSAQVAGLHRAGMQVGAHTCSHPILARLDDAAARREIIQSKQQLEALISAPVAAFAYPNGQPGRDYLATHPAMIREAGFSVAVSTAPGVAGRGSDLLQLPRFKPWDRSRWRYGVRMLANLRSAPARQV